MVRMHCAYILMSEVHVDSKLMHHSLVYFSLGEYVLYVFVLLISWFIGPAMFSAVYISTSLDGPRLQTSAYSKELCSSQVA